MVPSGCRHLRYARMYMVESGTFSLGWNVTLPEKAVRPFFATFWQSLAACSTSTACYHAHRWDHTSREICRAGAGSPLAAVLHMN